MSTHGKIKDGEAGACLPPCTFVARSNQINGSGATLPGFGFHQQSFSLGPPTGVSGIQWAKTRFISTPSLRQSRWGLNSYIPPP